MRLPYHPTNWLVEPEDVSFRRDLKRDFKFVLHGHEHTEWVSMDSDGWTQIAAGACYQRSDKMNGYNWVRLDLETGKGEVWLREYEARGRGWVSGRVYGKTDDRGVWPLNHLSWLRPEDISALTGETEEQPVTSSSPSITSENPFIYGRPVAPREFLNREAELRTVFNRLHNRESTAIVGEPHIGKSSLLLKLADERTQQKYLGDEARSASIVYLDLHSIPVGYDPRAFWEEALEPLWEHPDPWLTLRRFRAIFQADYTRRALERVFSHLGGAGRRLILLLDEFERLLDHRNFQSPSFFALLRSLASRTGGLVLVTATRPSVSEMNERSRCLLGTGSPFFNIMIDVRLRPFDDRAIDNLLDQASSTLSPEDRLFIRRVAGRHPFLLQAMAAALLETSDEDRYVRAAGCFYERIVSHFGDVWCSMDDYARTALVVLSLAELTGRAGVQLLASGRIEWADRFGLELKNMAKKGLVEWVEESWAFDRDSLPLWQGERLTVGSRAFAWWVRDVVVAESRRVKAYDEWLAEERYSVLLTREQWEQMLHSARSTPECVARDIETLAAIIIEELVRSKAS